MEAEPKRPRGSQPKSSSPLRGCSSVSPTVPPPPTHSLIHAVRLSLVELIISLILATPNTLPPLAPPVWGRYEMLAIHVVLIRVLILPAALTDTRLNIHQ